ncbi:hypothetical protein B6S12_07540 [Helicobacter valdiviensis]|uniref:Cytosine-specific methyltransferase n=1 Tax=Helicobacter valdiviensis TaxID=1458358 RepID=A0A2W6MT30_9HELI|nr:DNA (cytosine-5-)-methyltransferase [Helicobacter valdiviensis]PZT47705.1 hypothetical protein B6S12_07540 [Helicobacter valdiviensis]
MNILDLFSGIGGFSYGFKLANKENQTLAFVEKEEYCQKLLKKNFPNSKIFGDVLCVGAKELQDLGQIDVVCAGFPCQDLSRAGKKAGLEGERSGLFYEAIRIVTEVSPKYILFENVPELIWRDDYREEFTKTLQAIGYDCWWQTLCASSFGYPHKRKRAYVLCFKASPNSSLFGRILHRAFFYFYANEKPHLPSKEIISICSEYRRRTKKGDYTLHCKDIRRDDGLSSLLYQVRALGNSIIPKIAKLYALSLQTLEEIKGANLVCGGVR